MTKALVKLQTDPRSEKGATAVEYGLMVALIAIVIIAAVILLGSNLSTLFNTVARASDQLSTARAPAGRGRPTGARSGADRCTSDRTTGSVGMTQPHPRSSAPSNARAARRPSSTHSWWR